MSNFLHPPSLPLPSAAGWQFSLYPEAAEGSGSWRNWVHTPRRYVAPGAATDPERSAMEAGARARRSLRRYCAANRLNRLGTLTYAGTGCHDPLQVRADLGEFFRFLRHEIGGKPLPYVWVPEWHKSGHGLHAHFAVGQYIPRRAIGRAWVHGYFHIKMLGDLAVGATALSEARLAARYLSKYVGKTFTDPSARVLGLHRYDVAQGFKPEAVTFTGPTSADVIDQASSVFGSEPVSRWSSAEIPDWDRPPVVTAQWGV